jgi:DNA primase
MSDLWPESPVDAIKRRLTLLDLFPDATPSGGGGRWYMARCPFHDDASPSLRLDLVAGVAACFAGCLGRRGADVIALWARLHRVDNRRALRELAGAIGQEDGS